MLWTPAVRKCWAIFIGISQVSKGRKNARENEPDTNSSTRAAESASKANVDSCSCISATDLLPMFGIAIKSSVLFWINSPTVAIPA
jgi:hypothetical protein